MRSSARNLALAVLLSVTLLLAGCARETPEVREVRKATQEYLHALSKNDLKEIAARSTCNVKTSSIVRGRVLRVEPAHHVRMAAIDSLGRASVETQRAAESAWARADETTADSLFQRARVVSHQVQVYRNAVRAVQASAPGTIVAADSLLETRSVRAKVRYGGPGVGAKGVDREMIVRLLRAPGGKWIAFSFYLEADDPRPEMI